MRDSKRQFAKLSGSYLGNSGGDHRGFGTDGRPVIGGKHEDRDLSASEVLLIRKIVIRRNKDIEFLFRENQKRPILLLSPSHLLRGLDRVTGQPQPQWARHALIEEYFHAAAGSVRSFANSRIATASSRHTVGKHSKNSSRFMPLARYSKSDAAGTRVPLITGVPLIILGLTSISGTSVFMGRRYHAARESAMAF